MLVEDGRVLRDVLGEVHVSAHEILTAARMNHGLERMDRIKHRARDLALDQCGAEVSSTVAAIHSSLHSAAGESPSVSQSQVSG